MTELNRPVMEDEKLWDQIMELTPLKRWMSVEEAAEWIYFMAVKNRFCTGQNILIDGLEPETVILSGHRVKVKNRVLRNHFWNLLLFCA